MKPELPTGTPLPETPRPAPLSPEQQAVNLHLKRLSDQFLNETEAGPALIDLLKTLARRQGEVTLAREGTPPEQHLDTTAFIAQSTSFQKRLFDLVVNLPHRDLAHQQLAERLKSLLTENLGNEFTAAKALVTGCLGTVTLVDALGLLSETGLKPASGVVVNETHDQEYATDLEVSQNEHLYLFQIKTGAAIDNPIQVLDDSNPQTDWEKRMLYLKQIMARMKHIPENRIHRVLATVPSMGTTDVESYTGFLKPKVGAKIQKAYQTELAKIGFSSNL